MGLDISVRFRRKDAEPIDMDIWGHTCYRDADLHNGRDSFNGRWEYSVVREWVGDDRYGKFIPLVGSDYAVLLGVVEAELERRAHAIEKEVEMCFDEDEEQNSAFPWFLEMDCYGLADLYQYIIKAPTYEKYGWIMELECDW